MSNFTKSILYSTTVLVAGVAAIFAIYNNVSETQSNTELASIVPAAGDSDLGINFDGVMDSAKSAASGAVDSATNVVADAGSAISDGTTAAVKVAGEATDSVGSTLNDISTAAGDTASSAMEATTEAAGKAGTTLGDMAKSAKDAVADTVAPAADAVTGAAKDAAGAAVGIIEPSTGDEHPEGDAEHPEGDEHPEKDKHTQADGSFKVADAASDYIDAVGDAQEILEGIVGSGASSGAADIAAQAVVIPPEAASAIGSAQAALNYGEDQAQEELSNITAEIEANAEELDEIELQELIDTEQADGELSSEVQDQILDGIGSVTP